MQYGEFKKLSLPVEWTIHINGPEIIYALVVNLKQMAGELVKFTQINWLSRPQGPVPQLTNLTLS